MPPEKIDLILQKSLLFFSFGRFQRARSLAQKIVIPGGGNIRPFVTLIELLQAAEWSEDLLRVVHFLDRGIFLEVENIIQSLWSPLIRDESPFLLAFGPPPGTAAKFDPRKPMKIGAQQQTPTTRDSKRLERTLRSMLTEKVGQNMVRISERGHLYIDEKSISKMAYELEIYFEQLVKLINRKIKSHHERHWKADDSKTVIAELKICRPGTLNQLIADIINWRVSLDLQAQGLERDTPGYTGKDIKEKVARHHDRLYR